ncbi:hypothetical protein [Rufibacter ruber]|uniref:hypothetical protein n=1 Tax=Rufibacter ruber TaxID=1783499 RepID=UPI0008329D9B|nr:hypothetical protein [Rufibacter ruber]
MAYAKGGNIVNRQQKDLFTAPTPPASEIKAQESLCFFVSAVFGLFPEKEPLNGKALSAAAEEIVSPTSAESI